MSPQKSAGQNTWCTRVHSELIQRQSQEIVSWYIKVKYSISHLYDHRMLFSEKALLLSFQCMARLCLLVRKIVQQIFGTLVNLPSLRWCKLNENVCTLQDQMYAWLLSPRKELSEKHNRNEANQTKTSLQPNQIKHRWVCIFSFLNLDYSQGHFHLSFLRKLQLVKFCSWRHTY